MITSPGQLLVNDSLPEDLRRPQWKLDKKGVTELFTEIAKRYPDQYRDIAQKLMSRGHFAAQASGTTLRLADLLPPPEVEKKMTELRAKVQALSEKNMPREQRDKLIVDTVFNDASGLEKMLMDHGMSTGNNLAAQVSTGSRGNPTQLKQLVAGDILVSDHRDRVIPIPVLRGYATGIEPAEYFAAAYGARKGTIATKFATAQGGYLGKQLAMIAHRLVVTEPDCGASTGLPVEGQDKDNVGAVLARDEAGHKAGSIITADMLKDFKGKILVRSATTCQAARGVCSKCAGVREKGRLPDVGENVGMAAAQAISEPLAQSALSTKHGGGVVTKRAAQTSGFDYINRLIQTPKVFHGSAVVASKAGRITEIVDAPQGGKFVYVDNEKHYVPPTEEVTVKPGDKLDAGDSLSEGVPNPSDIVTHKGVGEGRRNFTQVLHKALADSGIKAHRRNVELVSRGLINHVKWNGEDPEHHVMPDDVVPYDSVTRTYRPRPDAARLNPSRALDMHLEHPALHYSIGTKITPKVAAELNEFGVDQVVVHPEPPPFNPMMVHGREVGLRDSNWITRMGSSYLEKGFLESAHRGRVAPTSDTSFYPSLTKGKGFGSNLSTTGTY